MFGSRETSGRWQSPVGDPDKIDIIVKRKDGTVDLLLVVAAPLDLSERTVDVFCRKLRGYCQYVTTDEFIEEFGEPTPETVCIGVRSDYELPDEYFGWIGQIRDEERPPAEVAVFYEYPPDPSPAQPL